jgi:hypothetical protein
VPTAVTTVSSTYAVRRGRQRVMSEALRGLPLNQTQTHETITPTTMSTGEE